MSHNHGFLFVRIASSAELALNHSQTQLGLWLVNIYCGKEMTVNHHPQIFILFSCCYCCCCSNSQIVVPCLQEVQQL